MHDPKVRAARASDRQVGSSVQGRVIELKVAVGDVVKKGDELLVVESPELGEAQSDYLQKRTAVLAATPAIDAAKSAYERAKSLYESSQGIALTELQKREVEYKTAQSTGLAATVIFPLIGAFVLSLTFIPAMIALVMRGRVREKENFLVRWAKRAYEPLLRGAVRGRWVVVPVAVLAFAASLLLFKRLGQEFVPTLDEQDMDVQTTRMPSTSLAHVQRPCRQQVGRHVIDADGLGERADPTMAVGRRPSLSPLSPARRTGGRRCFGDSTCTSPSRWNSASWRRYSAGRRGGVERATGRLPQ